jgi:hypothetical protein
MGWGLNGGLKKGHSGVISGEPEEYRFVEEIMVGGPSRPQVEVDGEGDRGFLTTGDFGTALVPLEKEQSRRKYRGLD